MNWALVDRLTGILGGYLGPGYDGTHLSVI
jgi:hypothetical protein